MLDNKEFNMILESEEQFKLYKGLKAGTINYQEFISGIVEEIVKIASRDSSIDTLHGVKSLASQAIDELEQLEELGVIKLPSLSEM